MNKILILIILLPITGSLYAQDTTKPFYFPHKTGDMWEYHYYDYAGPQFFDTLQNITIFDSVDSHGIIYIKQYAQFINPTKPSYILEDTTRYRIDTVNNYVYSYRFSWFGLDTALVYKLDAKKGEQWIVHDRSVTGGYGYDLARIKNKWVGSIFSKSTTFMEVFYFSASDSTDTTGYSVAGSRTIADGFGLISSGGGELIGQINLIGAVINGILYGDTTLVSVKDKKNALPATIKLYQNYPNPFNPSTTISFDLSYPQNISLVIYDILGKEIFRLVDNKYYSSGSYKITWDGKENSGSRAPNGIYFYRLITDKQSLTKSMILLK